MIYIYKNIPSWVLRNLVEKGNVFVSKKTYNKFKSNLDGYFGNYPYKVHCFENGVVIQTGV